jgi:hypothetical protein
VGLVGETLLLMRVLESVAAPGVDRYRSGVRKDIRQVLRRRQHLAYNLCVSGKPSRTSRSQLRKAVNETFEVASASGQRAVLREEVWVNANGAVVQYNLAYIDFGLCQIDNGRVLGYDNAHGHHERHFMGSLEIVAFVAYDRTAAKFYAEVEKLRKPS